MVTKCGWRKLSQKFILKNIEEIKNHFTKEIDQNEFMSNNERKNDCKTSKYIENFQILASAIIGCVSISAFDSLLGIPIELRDLQYYWKYVE